MSLGFDHRAIRFAAIVEEDSVARRWIGQAEREPRRQRGLALRIDDAPDKLLVLNIERLASASLVWLGIGTKLRLLALCFRRGFGAGLYARCFAALRLGRRAHGVGVDDNAASDGAGDRPAGLVAEEAILPEMSGDDDPVRPRDPQRSFVVVDLVVEAAFARNGAGDVAAAEPALSEKKLALIPLFSKIRCGALCPLV